MNKFAKHVSMLRYFYFDKRCVLTGLFIYNQATVCCERGTYECICDVMCWECNLRH